MKILTIFSKKFGAFNVMIDDIDFECVSRYTWGVMKMSSGYYVASRGVLPGYKLIYLHRFIMGVTDGKVCIDHRDKNTLNNQRSNLRTSTTAQNLMNRGPSLINKLGLKGVCLTKGKVNKYQVTIEVNQKSIHGGTFSTPVDAAKRYNELARQYHGEFAYQNPV